MPLTPEGFWWEVPGRVVSVLSGNQIVCDLDLGWYVFTRTRVRVYGLQLPTTRKEELDAKKYAQKLLPVGAPLIVRSLEVNRIARMCVAEILYGPGFEPRSDEGSFSLAMLASGLVIREDAHEAEVLE